MVKSLALFTGYAENQSLACLVVEHEEGFSDVESAAKNFRDIFLQYTQESLMPPCCSEIPPGANYCPICGLPVHDNVDKRDLFDELFYGTMNDTASAWEFFIDHGWTLSSFPTAETKMVFAMDELVNGNDEEWKLCQEDE